jgi:hypothetical protein
MVPQIASHDEAAGAPDGMESEVSTSSPARTLEFPGVGSNASPELARYVRMQVAAVAVRADRCRLTDAGDVESKGEFRPVSLGARSLRPGASAIGLEAGKMT